MKHLSLLTATLTMTCLFISSVHADKQTALNYAAPTLAEGVPGSFDLPGDFKPPGDAKQQNLGFRRTSGIVLEKHGAATPIYVVEYKKDAVPNDTLMVGDVILAVNGQPLGDNAQAEFRSAVRKSRMETGFLWLTRWRPSSDHGPGSGTVEQCFLDLGTKPLDLTQTLAPGPTIDWRLGPLGANGWCFHVDTRQGATIHARQILITAVDKDGPSRGKLLLNDVIVGTDGKPFTYDARRALAAAINEAEKEENNGQLKLLAWRDGKDVDVIVTLPVMGTYSDTAPFNCPKTEKIIDNAVAYMKANADTLLKPSDRGWLNYINGLGLLATGREDVMPIVRNLAHASMLKEGEELSVEQHVSMMCWWWSYKTVFLCEYYLRTGDEAVLPTIEEHATKIAMGQSGAGTWGHTYAAQANTGYLHGHLGGYGAINQQGLTLMIALPLAVKCGVENKEITDAIKRGDDFFSYFIDKGTIPYGDHGAHNQWYDDNGKSGSAAIVFDLLNKRKGATFFSEMVLGSAPSGREAGHTGHFWSALWGGVGAARGGEEVLHAFIKEMDHVFTLERQPDGRFVFQGNTREIGPKGKPKEKWDCTGARLLQLCVPKRTLYITGKETPKKTHLSRERIDDILRAGRLYIDAQARAKLTKEQILTYLQDPLPPTRAWAARTLAERNINCVPELIRRLDSTDKYTRYGAAEGLCKAGFGNKEAAEKLIRLMEENDDITFKSYAIDALINRDEEHGLLTAAKPAIPVLLRMAVKKYPDDPRGVLQQKISTALFYKWTAQPRKGLLAKYGLEGVPRELLIPAIQAILTNENGGARSMTRWVYDELTPAELEQLWADIYQATYRIAPSNIMFAPSIRTTGLTIMSHHHIKEGLDLAVWYIRYQKAHGSKGRIPFALAAIEGYGPYAKRVVPKLKEYAAYFEAGRNPRRGIAPDDPANLIRATIEKIQAQPDKPTFELVSIADELKEKGIDFPPKPIVIQTEVAQLGPRPVIPEGIPDLTKGQGPSVDEAKPDWFLHCGGTRGWIYRDVSGNCDAARQILVTKVPIDSAVRRRLKVGDVILGVKGAYFSKHAVYEFREASLPVKRVEGTLDVILWRNGWAEPRTVVLDLSHKPLDFTRGDTPGLAVDWNLGPTGTRGWIEGEHEESIQARQILITSVHKGSPAEGILRKGDVILGLDGKPFDRDARRAFGEAITTAETEEGKGQLSLLRWRDGTTETVTISIPVLGSYSRNTPWDCPKTARILENACDYLIKNDVLNTVDVGSGQANIAALALLATGDPEHEKLAKRYVYKLVGAMEQDKGYPPVWGYATWGWGYGNLLMTEYYLLTQDKAVLPAIERYSNLLAEGQSGAGSWGHRLAMPNHGPCPGYGAMNQAGTIAWMSLILAKRCGLTNPEIDQAIQRTTDYMSKFLGRQPIPYGDHINLKPAGHDDNGKTSAVACAYALLGDEQGTAFHSRMTIASYAVRERGHTGSWWSALWGPLGAARAGKDASGAFINEMTWLYDLERRWDGGFVYQGKAGVGYGVNPKTGRQKGGREHNNAHWDTTGSRILMYCLPRKRLCITGRDTLTVAIPDNEIAKVIEAGRPSPKGNKFAINRFDGRSTEELLSLLGNWSPVVRYHAGCSLAANDTITTAMITPILNSDNPYARYGVCQALRQMGPDATDAVPQLVELLESNDQLLQVYAIAALGDIDDARATAPLLKMAAGTIEGDSIGLMQRMVARALFRKGGLLYESIDGVDRDLLYPAVAGILRCNGGEERSMLANAVLKKLTFEELEPLWPVMIPSLREVAPTGIMFASGVRTTIATILAENKVEEGMELLLEYMNLQKRHGGGTRSKLIMDQLVKYGASAKPMIPAIEEYIRFCEIESEKPWADIGRPPRNRFYKGQIPYLKAAIKAIQTSEETPELISIQKYK